MKLELGIIVRETVQAREGGDVLLAAVENNTLTSGERTVVCGWLADRLVAEGLEPNYEPNALGQAIEAALDEVNRPNLLQ